MSDVGGTTAPRALGLDEVRAGLTPQKVRPNLDRHCRAFIARSPFLTIATVNAAGDADVSPRGDPPGSVRVLDDATIAIPERPGNRLADSLVNILETGSVGLLFLVPGVEETLRVNGHATVTDDATLLAEMAVNGKAPKLAIVVRVDEAYIHCAKAFKRSHLWDPSRHVARNELPTLGEMIRDQVEPPGMTAADVDEFAESDYRVNMY
jgi:PPOX class probable FMN-dependent enzyme